MRPQFISAAIRDRGATKPQAQFGATLWAAVLFESLCGYSCLAYPVDSAVSARAAGLAGPGGREILRSSTARDVPTSCRWCCRYRQMNFARRDWPVQTPSRRMEELPKLHRRGFSWVRGRHFRGARDCPKRRSAHAKLGHGEIPEPQLQRGRAAPNPVL